MKTRSEPILDCITCGWNPMSYFIRQNVFSLKRILAWLWVLRNDLFKYVCVGAKRTYMHVCMCMCVCLCVRARVCLSNLWFALSWPWVDSFVGISPNILAGEYISLLSSFFHLRRRSKIDHRSACLPFNNAFVFRAVVRRLTKSSEFEYFGTIFAISLSTNASPMDEFSPRKTTNYLDYKITSGGTEL